MAGRRRTRRSEAEEPENHERWLVSYADFITLLFAFFVVMYAISSVNEGKYRVLSESLEDAFAIQPRSSLPIQVGELTRTTRVIDHMVVNLEQKQLSAAEAGIEHEALSDEQQLLQLAELIRQELSPFIDEKLIEVKKKDFWVEIEMKSAVLFPSGRAALADAALPVLNRIAALLKQIPNPVFVEGYTDNVPIDTFEFPSNWELSASRAASVVHHFFREGVPPDHLAAIGYGEYHPVADNSTEEGRYQNRRIVVVLMSRAMARHKLADNSRAAFQQAARNQPAGGGGVQQP